MNNLNMNLRVTFQLVIILLLLSSCSSPSKENSTILVLDSFITDLYVFLSERTRHYNKNDYPMIEDIDTLKKMTDKVLMKNRYDKEEILHYELLINQILDNYHIEGAPSAISFQSLSGSIKFKIKMLEYIALNSMSRYFEYKSFDLDMISTMIMAPEKSLHPGDEIVAKVFLVANNHFNPFVVIIGGDTLSEIDESGFAYIYRNKSLSKGTFIKEGSLILNHHGAERMYDFEFAYTID